MLVTPLAFVEQKLHRTQALSIRNLRSMRKHNGMRPQDVLILLKLITLVLRIRNS